MHREKRLKYRIRKADTSADVTKCFELASQVSLKLGRGGSTTGFLLGTESEQDYHDKAKDGTLLICEDCDLLLGFVMFYSRDTKCYKRLFTKERIEKLGNPDQLEARDIFYIDKIVVSSTARGSGVGSILYRYLFEQHPESTFIAFITTAPVSNIPSLKFHRKMGFSQIATFTSPELAFLKNYESVLFARKPE